MIQRISLLALGAILAMQGVAAAATNFTLSFEGALRAPSGETRSTTFSVRSPVTLAAIAPLPQTFSVLNFRWGGGSMSGGGPPSPVQRTIGAGAAPKYSTIDVTFEPGLNQSALVRSLQAGRFASITLTGAKNGSVYITYQFKSVSVITTTLGSSGGRPAVTTSFAFEQMTVTDPDPSHANPTPTGWDVRANPSS